MDNSKTFGYARVSTKDQNEARQLEAVKNFGIDERDIYIDKKSGKDFDREQYKILLNILREGDLLVITSLDRLGRNYEETKNNWYLLTHEKKVDIVVLEIELLDTRKYKDILGTFVADLVLNILAFNSSEELTRIRRRQREGIDVCFKTKTTKTGRWFGRPRKILADNFNELYPKWKNKEITSKEFMRQTNLKPYVFYNFIREYENKNN